MASLLPKLLRNQFSTNFYSITAVNKPQLSNLVLPLLTHLHHEPNLAETKSHYDVNAIPFFGPSGPGDSISPCSTLIFPSFPFGFSLNPIISTGFAPAYAEEDLIWDDTRTIWADSVKKKRKRKMNKHKYRKLRKRLRKRT